jgi:hypothetical protein
MPEQPLTLFGYTDNALTLTAGQRIRLVSERVADIAGCRSD